MTYFTGTIGFSELNNTSMMEGEQLRRTFFIEVTETHQPPFSQLHVVDIIEFNPGNPQHVDWALDMTIELLCGIGGFQEMPRTEAEVGHMMQYLKSL